MVLKLKLLNLSEKRNKKENLLIRWERVIVWKKWERELTEKLAKEEHTENRGWDGIWTDPPACK